MSNTTSMNLRIDKNLKKDAETLFNTLGINMTTAINIFLKQSVRDQGIPFQVTASNEKDVFPTYKGDADKYANYQELVANSLKEADIKVAEGKMKYYTVDEIRSKLEDILDENV